MHRHKDNFPIYRESTNEYRLDLWDVIEAHCTITADDFQQKCDEILAAQLVLTEEQVHRYRKMIFGKDLGRPPKKALSERSFQQALPA